ncbi:MAG: TraB/GumN family protein, partial [Bacteroidetes bacterium]
MRSSFPFCLLAAVFAFSCKGQPTFEKADPNSTLLWQVTGGQLKQPAYIFGTMHMVCPDDAKLSKNMQAVVAHVNAVYFEVDMDDMVAMFGGMKTMAMGNNTKLVDLLSLDEYEKVSQYFGAHSKLPFSTVENYKPMLLSSMLAEHLMPCKSVNGMEISILNEANKYKKDILGLETLEFQSGLFDSIP